MKKNKILKSISWSSLIHLILDSTQENTITGDLDREKRKLPEATFGTKNAILGYVFGVSVLNSVH